MKLKKWLIIPSAVIVLLVVIFIIIRSAATYAARKDLARAVVELEARGDEVTIEMLKRHVPPEENACPALQNAFSLLEKYPALRDGPTADETADPKTNIESLRHKVEEGAPFFQALDKAFAFPKCEFPLEWEKGFAMLLPHLANVRAAGRALHLRCLLHIARNDAKAAVGDIQNIVSLSNFIADEPLLISFLVRIACLNMAYNALERLLAETSCDEESLTNLKKHIEAPVLREQFIFTLRCERDMLCRPAISQFAEHPQALVMFEGSREKYILEFGYFLCPWIPYRDEAFFIRSMNRIIDFALLPWPEAKVRSDALENDLKSLAGSIYKKLTHFSTLHLVPVMLKGIERLHKSETAAELALVGASLGIYKARHGDFPDSLDALEEKGIVETVPEDRFSGEPYVYRKTASGFIIYSVGEDGKDDGGRKTGHDGLDVAFTTDKPEVKAPPPPPAGNNTVVF